MEALNTVIYYQKIAKVYPHLIKVETLGLELSDLNTTHRALTVDIYIDAGKYNIYSYPLRNS